MDRNEVLKRLRKQIDSGMAIIGAGAGTGISAKSAEEGGVDLIIIYNSGRYRNLVLEIYRQNKLMNY